MSKPPIFIVGVQRSGTTLLAALLAAHSRMSCGPETHFFRWLAEEEEPSQLCRVDNWPERAVSFVSAITATTYSPPGHVRLVERYNVDEVQLASYLQQHKPSIANLLGSITVPYMVRQGKHRWVEKTPDHIQYVTHIRRYFPNSPIIRIVRDPRDVALSLRKVPWGAKTLPEGLLFWKRLHDSSNAFFDEDPCSYTLRFEDLLSSPQEALRTLCHFIDEGYEEQMLDTSQTGLKVNSRQVAWKEKASQPIDSSRAAAWREGLSSGENQLAEALVGDYLNQFQYPRLTELPYLAEVYPAPLPTDRHTAELIELAGKGIRFWRKSPDEKPTARIYVGNPGDYSWLGKRKSERALKAAGIAKNVVQAHVTHKKLFWIAGGPVEEFERALAIPRVGVPAILLQRLLNRYRVNYSA